MTKTPHAIFKFLRQDKAKISKIMNPTSVQTQSAVQLGEWKKYVNNQKLSRKELFNKVKLTASQLEREALKKMAVLQKGFQFTTHQRGLASNTSLNLTQRGGEAAKSPIRQSFGKSERFKDV